MIATVRALRRRAQGALSLSRGAAVAAALALPAAVLLLPPTASAVQAQQPGVPPAEPQQTPPPEVPQPGVPGAPAPTPAAPPTPAVVVPGVPVAAPAPVARAFAAPNGVLFNTVRTERLKDFELFLGYLRQALDKATDPGVQSQARGWRMFRATEPGPNNTALYVFLFDPAVPGADYSLGRILADAYPDAVQLNEIWKLYTGAVVGGGSLLNLTPLKPVVPPPGLPVSMPGAPASSPIGPAPTTPPATAPPAAAPTTPPASAPTTPPAG